MRRIEILTVIETFCACGLFCFPFASLFGVLFHLMMNQEMSRAVGVCVVSFGAVDWIPHSSHQCWDDIDTWLVRTTSPVGVVAFYAVVDY
jgi:hypothetical protein